MFIVVVGTGYTVGDCSDFEECKNSSGKVFPFVSACTVYIVQSTLLLLKVNLRMLLLESALEIVQSLPSAPFDAQHKESSFSLK